jgi:hypothetical protein
MEKVKIYSNFSRTLQFATMCFAMVLMQFSAFAQNTCAPLTTSLPASCTLSLAAIVVPGGGTVTEVKRNGRWSTAPITGADVGKTLEYRKGSTDCWNIITVEDKTPPVITAPASGFLFCNQLVDSRTASNVAGDAPCPKFTGDLGIDRGPDVIDSDGDKNTTEIVAYNSATNYLFPGFTDGTATDCTEKLMAGYSPGFSCSLTGDESYIDCVFETSCRTPFTSADITTAKITGCVKDVTTAGVADIQGKIAGLIGTGDVFKFIIREWRSTDHYGNISLPAYQVIAIRNLPNAPIITAKSVIYNCGGDVTHCGVTYKGAPADLSPTEASDFPFLDIDLNGVYSAGDIYLNSVAAKLCGLELKYEDVTFDICMGYSKKISRTWTVKDWCGKKSGILATAQDIMVLDLVQPDVITKYTSYKRVPKTICTIDAWGVSNRRTIFEVVGEQKTLANFTGKTITGVSPVCEVASTPEQLFAIGDANVCGKFNVNFEFTVCDPKCTGADVTMTSNFSNIVPREVSRRLVNGVQYITYVAKGTISLSEAALDPTIPEIDACDGVRERPYCATLKFSAKDKCGYAIANQDFKVLLIDNIAPQAVCITSHTATVGTDGTVRIDASTFNNGSTDNCGIQMYMVRRMDGKVIDETKLNAAECGRLKVGESCLTDRGAAILYNDNRYPFRNAVEFGCEDATGTPVMVEMLVMDQNCNVSSCMVSVIVQNKQKPVCANVGPLTFSCTEAATVLANLPSYGTASVYGNCGYSVFEKAPTVVPLDCGVGSITRNWGVRSCDGIEVTGVNCTQRISFTPKSDFKVDFPQDRVYECTGVMPTIKETKDAMLTNPWGTDGSIKNDGCGVIVVGIEDEDVMGTTGSDCMKKFRKICVYDWCKYQPNASGFDYRFLDAESGENCYSDDNGKNSRFIFRDADQLSYNYSDGYICHIQVLKVEDNTAPVLTPRSNVDACFAKGACVGNINETVVANDNCGAVVSSSLLQYTWTVFTKSGKLGDVEVIQAKGTTRFINEASIDLDARGNKIGTLNGLAAGVYTIRWTAKDQCGNLQLAANTFTVTLKDCEGPAILVHAKIAELSYVVNSPLPGNGMVTVTLQDLFNSVQDNCDPAELTYGGFLSSKMGLQRASEPVVYTSNKSLMLGCADRGTVRIRVWAQDRLGNNNYIITAVEVQDNSGACNGPISRPLVGAAGTENGKAVNAVTISAKAAGLAEVNANTINDGSFNMNITRDQDYVVSASKVDQSDKFLGVTTFDIAKISKHLLDIEKIASPYSLIAADVDMSGEIDGADMLKIRNFILRKSDNLNTNSTIWRFVDKSYAFKNAASPLTEDFSTVVSLKKVGDRSVANFVAVKLGDVNTTYTSEAVATVRNAKTLNFTTEDISVVAGNEYTVNIAAENFNAAAFQGTFSFTNATVKAAKGSLLTDANMAIFSNAITTSWNGNAQANDIMAITFVANKSGKLSEVLAINSALTPAVANDVNGTEMNLNLKFTNGAVTGGEFALNNATPNPVKFETVIGFNLPKDSKTTLTVYTTEGKVLVVKPVDAKAGANQITLTKGDLNNASGVMYYRLETADFSATKKMIVIE